MCAFLSRDDPHLTHLSSGATQPLSHIHINRGTFESRTRSESNITSLRLQYSRYNELIFQLPMVVDNSPILLLSVKSNNRHDQ